MIDVFAFVALVVAVSATSLCHHAQPMPGVAWFRRLARPHPRPFEDAPANPRAAPAARHPVAGTPRHRQAGSRMTDTPAPAPAVGQIWQDNDPRGYGRKVRIVEIDDTHAVVEPALPRGAGHLRAKPGRRTRLRLDRLRPTSTGYRYVSGPT